MTMPPAAIGHNIRGFQITVETRLFNSLTRFAGKEGPFLDLVLPAGSTLADVLRALSVPIHEVFFATRNGRDVTPSLTGGINGDAAIEEGDVIALSGPVPYSWGYGSPVV